MAPASNVSVFATGLDSPRGLFVSGVADVTFVDGTLHAFDNSIEPIVSGLMLPTAMTIGPDGALYVSTFGFGPAGAGSIVRVAS